MLTKQEISLGKGTWVEGRRVREPRRAALPQRWLAVSGFLAKGLVYGLSLANHSDLELFQVVQPCLAKMDAREKDSGRWSDMWCLLLTFPSSSGWWRLINSIFLTRTFCVKQLMQMVTMVPGQGGRFQSASPNKSTDHPKNHLPALVHDTFIFLLSTQRLASLLSNWS